jgi:hypothetical protein
MAIINIDFYRGENFDEKTHVLKEINRKSNVATNFYNEG